MHKNVHLACGWVPDSREWVKKNVCPYGALDLWAADLDVGTPLHVYQNVFDVCAPRMLLIENAAAYSFRSRDDHWQQFMIDLLLKSRSGKGQYRILVDTKRSHLALVDDEPEPRVHSLLCRRDYCIS